MAGNRKQNKKKPEFSKIFGVLLTVAAVIIGIWIISKHFALTEMAILNGSVISPDASLAIAAVTAMIVPNIAYDAYQGFLKNSRNKHGIDKNGNPYGSHDEPDNTCDYEEEV